MFACVLMRRIVRDHPGASIVYFDNKLATHKYICFTPGAAPRLAECLPAFRTEVQQSSNFVIFDASGSDCPPVPSRGINAQHIVISSANPQHYTHWARSHPLRVVLPAWSLEEISQAHARIYNHANFDDYELRFRTFGGVPRYVFASDATFAEVRDRFKLGIPNADAIAKLLMSWNPTALTEQEGACLLTYDVDAELEIVRTRWASDEIGQWSMERLDEKRAMSLLSVMSEHPSLREQFDLAFQPWAHLTLAKGGTFQLRRVGHADRGETLHLNQSETTYFHDFNMVQDHVSVILRRVNTAAAWLMIKRFAYMLA